MRTRDAREIRRGLLLARADLGAGVRRRLTPFGFADAPKMPRWEQAYHREISQAVRDGRIRPPRGPAGNSGVSRARSGA